MNAKRIANKPGLECGFRYRPLRPTTVRLLNHVLVTLFALPMLNSVIASSQKTTQSQATPMPVAQTLAIGDTVPRHMISGETHKFKLRLTANQFARIVVEQKGVDVGVRVWTPRGVWPVDMDSPNGFYGPEIVSVIASTAGSYRIEVYSSSGYPDGEYELKVEASRDASADSISVNAEHAFMEGQKLRWEAPGFPRQKASEIYRSAISKYNEALASWHEVGDLRGQGYTLTNIGRCYRELAEGDAALDHFARAQLLLHEAGDISGEAFALNEAGFTYDALSDARQAVFSYERALDLRLDLGDRYGQAQLYNNLGLTFSHIGSQPRSIESHEKAIAIWRALGVRGAEINTLINAAKAHVEMGDIDAARLQYQTVLDFCNAELTKEKPIDVRRLKAFALNGLGLVFDTLADTDTALTNYQESLKLFREIEHHVGEADVLDNLGLAYAFLGDAQEAIKYFQEALANRELAKEPRGWGMTLSNLGYAYTLLGHYPEAQEQLRLALPLSIAARDRRFEAYTLIRLGMTYAEREPLKALEYYQRALAIQQEPSFQDRRGQAITLDKIAEALTRTGQESQALKQYENAIERWKTVGDEQGEALSLYGIARIERDRTNLANARDRIEEAIGIVEKLRHRVTGRQLQMTYFAEKQDLYTLAIDVRMQLYISKKSPADLEAALAFSEKARARNLLDLLSVAQTDLYQRMPPKLAEMNRHLEQQISELKQNLLRFRGVDAKKDAADVQRILDARINDHDRLLASLRTAAGRSIQALPLGPQEIQQLLDDDTMLLQYSLDEKRSHLWKVTQGEIKYFPLAGQAEIETAANKFRRALVDLEPQRQNEPDPEESRKRRQAARANYGQSAANLSRLILNDVAPQLGNKRLVIVADGALQSIPFEALPLPESVITPVHHASDTAQRPLLLESNEIVYQPSASALAMLRRIPRPTARKTVAVLADPVFNDNERARRRNNKQPAHPAKEKLTRSLRDIGDADNGNFTLQPLEFSRQEAKAITAVAPRGTSMLAVGFEANRALATSPILKQFSIVHFATHGILNDKNPELSGLVLSMFNKRGQPQDGYLTLRDIYNLDLPVHLVVVSACETGIGKPVRGEGLIALTRGFMNAGAQSIVVSLWRVEDEATAELMKRFYTHLFSKNRPFPAAALRQAKLEMKDHYDPYHWAGFVLQGDWK